MLDLLCNAWFCTIVYVLPWHLSVWAYPSVSNREVKTSNQLRKKKKEIEISFILRLLRFESNTFRRRIDPPPEDSYESTHM